MADRFRRSRVGRTRDRLAGGAQGARRMRARRVRRALARIYRRAPCCGQTFTHPYLTASREARRQLERTIAAIRVLTGYTPCVFRPPYGAYNGSVVRTARALGLATVLWNDDPRDWALPGIYAIARTAL